jgi:hypothetical protein
LCAAAAEQLHGEGRALGRVLNFGERFPERTELLGRCHPAKLRLRHAQLAKQLFGAAALFVHAGDGLLQEADHLRRGAGADALVLKRTL